VPTGQPSAVPSSAPTAVPTTPAPVVTSLQPSTAQIIASTLIRLRGASLGLGADDVLAITLSGVPCNLTRFDPDALVCRTPVLNETVPPGAAIVRTEHGGTGFDRSGTGFAFVCPPTWFGVPTGDGVGAYARTVTLSLSLMRSRPTAADHRTAVPAVRVRGLQRPGVVRRRL
jgi:hypothetical protein